MKDLLCHPGSPGSNPGCDAIYGLSFCWFLSLLSKVPFFGFSVKSSLQVLVRNVTLEHMYTSSQELDKFAYEILSCNYSSWSQPHSWTQKKKHFPRVFHRVVKHPNTLQLLFAHYIFLFQLFNTCIENSEKTDDLDKRLQILLTNCTKSVYTNVAR